VAPSADPALATLLRELATRMTAFAVAVQTPRGTAPLLGEGGAETVPSTRELAAYARRLGLTVPPDEPAPAKTIELFEPSGIGVYRAARHWLLADVSGVGPPYLPGHGHCDSLHFEWWVKGVPIVVDTGTCSYERGPARHTTRATAAHNTLEI